MRPDELYYVISALGVVIVILLGWGFHHRERAQHFHDLWSVTLTQLNTERRIRRSLEDVVQPRRESNG